MEESIEKSNEVTPERIFQTAFAQMSTGVLITSVDLEIYTLIKNGCSTAAEIAEAAEANPRGMEILLNNLAALNFLTKSGDTYQLKPFAEKFLVKSSPAYIGDWVEVADMHRKFLMHLTEAVKTGKHFAKIEQEAGQEINKKLVPRLFPVSYPSAKFAARALGVGKTWKNLEVLDIGAGSGAWGIAFAEFDAGTKVTTLDWPGVLEITKTFVGRFGLNDRFTYQSGDMQKIEFGREKYDLVILGGICHNHGAEMSRSLFLRAHRALKPGGKLLISEFVPDDERKSSVVPLLFGMFMFVSSTDGNTFTMKEYRQWLQDAGFSSIDIIGASGPTTLIIANK